MCVGCAAALERIIRGRMDAISFSQVGVYRGDFSSSRLFRTMTLQSEAFALLSKCFRKVDTQAPGQTSSRKMCIKIRSMQSSLSWITSELRGLGYLKAT